MKFLITDKNELVVVFGSEEKQAKLEFLTSLIPTCSDDEEKIQLVLDEII